jgi:NADH-quinone oxidoreductase subunit K
LEARLMAIPLWWYLIVAAGLFSIGVYCTMTRRNAINVLMGIELMLNAVNLNAVAFWRFVSPTQTLTLTDAPRAYITAVDGQMFAVFVIALAAAEAAVGLALIIAIYRERRTVALDLLTSLRG